MIWMTVIVIILLALLSASCFYVVKFGAIVIQVQDVVEESIEILDQRHESITKILKTPLFYDSSEVRQVLYDIEASRQSIFNVAIALTSIDNYNEEDDVNNEG